MSSLMTEYNYATDIVVQKEKAYEDRLFAGRGEGISIGLERGLERGVYQKVLEIISHLAAADCFKETPHPRSKWYKRSRM